MKLNEQELNYILSECLQNILNEDFTPQQIKNAQKNRVFKNNIIAQNDVDSETWDNTTQSWTDNPQLRYSSSGAGQVSKKGRFGRSGVKKALKTVVGAMVIGSLFGKSNIGNLLGTLSMFGGIAAALRIVGASHRRYDILNKMKIPRSANMAKQVASLAAAERISLQMECKNLQGNYKNAEKAYNKLAQANNINLVSWDELSKQIGSNFSITEKYLGGGEGEVNINTNFNNHNVTESKLYEANLNAQEFNQSIQGVDYFSNAFKYDDGSFDTKTGLETVAGIAALYKETYVLWYKWTRYIQVLIKYFPNDLKWNEIMKTAGTVKPESIWNTLYRIVFPEMSQITDALSDGDSQDEKTKEDIEKEINDEYGSTKTITITNVDFKFDEKGDGKTNDYIIFEDETGKKYSLLKMYFPSAVPNTSYQVASFNTFLTNNAIYDDDGDIPKLKPSIVRSQKVKRL